MRLVPIALLALTTAAAVPQTPPESWHEMDLIQPAQFAAQLKHVKLAKPAVLYVGFGVLYRSKHIPGAVFAGPGSKQEGLEALRAAVLKRNRNEEIVIYCGCCPWDHCPNIRPAFLMLRELGFKRIKVLALPTSFLKDWIEKGYPAEQGQAQ